MSLKIQDRIETIAGAIALGEASDAERREYREHISTCRQCLNSWAANAKSSASHRPSRRRAKRNLGAGYSGRRAGARKGAVAVLRYGLALPARRLRFIRRSRCWSQIAPRSWRPHFRTPSLWIQRRHTLSYRNNARRNAQTCAPRRSAFDRAAQCRPNFARTGCGAGSRSAAGNAKCASRKISLT